MILALENLKYLSDDWDGYGSPRIDLSIIQSADNLLKNLYSRSSSPTPQAVPIPGGRIQLEWDRDGKSLEIEFEDVQTIRYLKWWPDKGVEEEGVLPVSELDKIRQLLEWLTAEETHEEKDV